MAISHLTSIPGLSKVFPGGVVCYQDEVKSILLQVDESFMAAHTCASKEVSTAIAKGVNRLIPADVSNGIPSLSSTGGSESSSKPVGSIFVTILINETVIERNWVLKGNRDEIRKNACSKVFDLLYSIIFNKNKL